MTTGRFASGPMIKLSDASFTLATARALESLPAETGGIMVGWWEDGQTAVIQELLLVNDPSAGGHHYDRAHSPAQEILELHQITHKDERCGYIGEWHSHPAPQPPSWIDRRSLADIVRESRAPVALIVLSVNDKGNVVPHGLIGRPRRLRRVAIDPAPVRKTIQ